MKSQKLRELFLHFIAIDGVSLHERLVADEILSILRGWDIEVYEDDAGRRINGNTGNLIAKIPAKNSHITSPLLLLAHMDTVRSTAGVQAIIENDGVIHSDGRTILGADNRAGVALILSMIDHILQNDIPHRPLEVVFSVAEELGMLGASALDFNRLSAKEAYVFDCSAPPGSYVAETPTAMDFKIIFKGKAAHSAVAPEKGINALTMAMAVMNRFPVGRINPYTVANIGTIHGGTADNVVPDQVTITGEFRSFKQDEIASIRNGLEENSEKACAQAGGTCEISFNIGFVGFRLTPDLPVIKRLHHAFRELSLAPHPLVYSGGSDANVLYAHGIHTVNMGIGAANAHSTDEKIGLQDMEIGAEILLKLIQME